jgi:sporulation protein YlmC with PRC-barrel domain
MQLFGDVMDKEIVDCNGRKAGKVDDLLLDLREGRPVVRAIITGHGSLAPLLGSKIAGLVGWFRERLLGESHSEPVRIGWEHVTHIDVVVHLDVDRHTAGLVETDKLVWERWISRLPFSER